ncbi:hypothetical protein BDZ91DRAFT_730981 [Kalaharituber pfeilii]|nr:hypothetical protein BDZ91DRAFT_730981 [Kalaharituber pfeilii]
MYHFACYSKLHHTIALHHDIDIALHHYHGRTQPSQYPHSRPIIGNWNRNNRVHAVILQLNSYVDISIARKCILTGGLIFNKPTASVGRSTLLVVLTFWVG